MRRSVTTSLLFLCMLVGCDSPKSSLGELPEEMSSSETNEPPPASSEVGAPCQLSFLPEARLLDLGNPGCGSGMCLFADSIFTDSQQSCTEAEDCIGFGEGVICSEAGLCQLDPDLVATRSMCTETCVEDADCVGVEGTACEGGFACVPIAALGPACCQPVCACRDGLDLADAQVLADQCAEGTAPGCCEQEPTPEACGG